MAEQRQLITVLESISGKKFDDAALATFLNRVNRQEEYLEEVRQMIATAPTCPVRIGEQITNVMATQWHRGSEWALNHAKVFRDEVKARVDAGTAACPGERKRLMWVGAGLWHNTAFYEAFEASHGAAFVWSIYLPFGPDWYIRYFDKPGLDDPLRVRPDEALRGRPVEALRALASHVVTRKEVLHDAPYAPAWIVHEAQKNRLDGAVVLMPKGSRPSAAGTLFITGAQERAGIPTLLLESDMVDARNWDGAAVDAAMARFLEERVR